MKSRLPLPDLRQITPHQREVMQSVQRSRGSLDGPFLAWLHSPEFASRAERLGAFCRYETELTSLESELLILVVAKARRCRAEWQIHAPLAEQAGLSATVIATIEQGMRPQFNDERLQTLFAVADELTTIDTVRPTTYTRAEQILGVKQLVEVVGLIGYYSLVACTLNAFEISI